MTVFTSSGTWMAPSGVVAVLIECWGPGGAGAAGASGNGGGGGGGGEYASDVVGVTGGNTYSFTIAAATNTTFTGDVTTVTAHQGAAGSGTAGGAGGTGSANGTHFNGGAGASATSGGGGAGGGSSAGTASAGNNGTANSGTSGGAGATAPSGGGGGGTGGASTATGTAGTVPGGGGGGGGYSLGGHAGGAGAGGQIRLTILTTGTGSLGVKKPGISVTATESIPGTGSVAVKKPAMAATGNVTPSFGRMTVKKPAMAATGNVSPAGTGSLGVKKPVMSGSGTLVITGSGGLAVKKPGIAAGGSQVFPFPLFPLTFTVEILLNGTWTDITQYVYQRADIQITSRGRPDESQTVQPTQITMTLNNRDGRFSPKNPSGAYYPYIARNIQLRLHLDTASGTGVPYTGYRFWGQVAEWAPDWDETGKDAICDVTASGILRIFSQGAPIGSPMRRYYTSLTGDFVPVAYWPGEDKSQSAEIAAAAGTAGPSPMTFTGSPGFGGDSSFGGSDPIPTVGTSSWHGVTNASADPPGTGSLTQTTPGTYKFTAPPGVTTMAVVCIGSGGGGGDTGATKGGGGGGGGEQAADSAVAVTEGTTYTYVVPPGGAAGAASNGFDGSPATFAGDSVTVTGHGGKGGVQGDVATGGAGGTGSSNASHHNGGAGGQGEAAVGSFQDDTVFGADGAQGGGSGSAGQRTSDWTCPAGVTSVDVTAVGGGGGGGGGGFFGYGGAGGGGGGFSEGTITTTPGNSYTFAAGNGGGGGPGNADLSDCSGGDGGNSSVTGDGGGSVTGEAGTGAVASSSHHNSNGSGGGGSTGNGSDGGLGNNGSNIGGGGGGGGSGDSPGSGSSSSGSFGGSGGGDGGAGGNGGSLVAKGTTGSSGGGGGGGGSTDNQHGQAGGGGGGGYIEWTYTIPGVPSGGGGGGSGGTSAAGNTGSNTGTGAAAVTGGGAGGSVGGAAGVPGGGGAGGLMDIGHGATAAGNGAPGSVHLAWDGGISSPIAADIVRFLLKVDSSGDGDGHVLFRVLTYGTIAKVDLVYHTGGKLELIGYNGDGVSVFDSGSQAFGADGTPMMVSIELTASGTSTNWSLSAIEPGASSVIATYTGTVTSSDVGNVSDVYAGPDANLSTGTSIGQISVQTYADTLVNLAALIGGYDGEYAADRFARLCASVGITSVLVGNVADTPKMGPQANDTFANLMQSVEDLDQGQLFEPRDQLGLGYRTRVSMLNQNPALIIDYAAGMLAGKLKPVVDDQLTRNDITLTRTGGSSATAILDSGPMSVLDPPDGVGDYSYSLTVAAHQDSQLANLIAWLLARGTVDEYRYPVVTINLARAAAAPIFADTANLDIADLFEIVNAPAFLTNAVINELAFGFTETLNKWKWTIDVNAVPESPYNQASPPTW